MKFTEFLCLLMFFCMPFTHALALNFVVCAPVIMAIVFVCVSLLFVRTQNPYVRKSDFLLIALWALLSSSFGFGSMTQTSVNHWIAYTIFLLLTYFGCGRAINCLVGNHPAFFISILKVISFMLFFACLYGIADWLVFQFTGSEIPIFRPEGGGNGMAANIVRARGFSGEPSGLANFILLWAPLAFWHIFSRKGERFKKIIFSAVVCVAFVATFSAKGILTLLSSLPFLFLFLALRKGLNPLRIAGVVLFVAIVIGVIISSGLGEIMYDAIVPKFFGSDIYEARMSRGVNVVNYINGLHWLVGYGPASYVELIGHDGETFLSGFAYLLGDSGMFGVAFFLIFLVSQLFFIKDLPFPGLKVAFTLTVYYIATGEIIAPIHYSIGFYLVIVILHVSVFHKNKIWRTPCREVFLKKNLKDGNTDF